MDRRAFLGTLSGGLLAAPLGAQAQEHKTVYRLGMLAPGAPPASSGPTSANLLPLLLRER